VKSSCNEIMHSGKHPRTGFMDRLDGRDELLRIPLFRLKPFFARLVVHVKRGKPRPIDKISSRAPRPREPLRPDVNEFLQFRESFARSYF
jgi:hypothetical protein